MGSNDWIPTFDSAQDLSSIITQVGVNGLKEMLETNLSACCTPNGCSSAGLVTPRASASDKMPTFHAKDVLGCAHYARKCKIYAECCQKWVSCRVCHDKAAAGSTDHELKAENVHFMLCLCCGLEQRIAQNCIGCSASMGAYWCKTCRLWEDSTEGKPIFHCDACGICRQGKRECFEHCNRCNCCLSKSYASSHKCIERNLECDCPICGDYLFTSRHPVTFMQCGHAIHVSCFYKMELKATHTCPVCQKSVRDMRFLFERWDEIMAAQQMPEEYANDRSLILCNDCERRTETKYHFYYHKCCECSSYNTKVIEVIKAAARPSARETAVLEGAVSPKVFGAESGRVEVNE